MEEQGMVCTQSSMGELELKHELELRKHWEKEMLSMLEVAYRERDEARQLVQMLLNNNNNQCTPAPASSSALSPLQTTLEQVSCPDQYFRIDQNSAGASLIPDFGDAIIDDLASGKILPQKGNLFEAIIDAGPLLKTLLQLQ